MMDRDRQARVPRKSADAGEVGTLVAGFLAHLVEHEGFSPDAVLAGAQSQIATIMAASMGGNSRIVRVSKNPAVAIQSDAMTRARLLAAELGCTPVSRSRPSVEDNEGDEDLFQWGGA